MAINASIPLGVNPLQLQMPDPNAGMNALARAMQIRGMQDEQSMNSFKMGELQRGVERRNRLDSLLAQDYAKPEDREGALMRGGFLDEATKLGKDRRELLKADTEQQKAALEMGLRKAEHVGSVLSLAKDPASYATVRAVIKQQFGQDLPEAFDPAVVQAIQAQGQTLTQRLAAEHQRLLLAETARGHDLTAATARRGQDMTAATARRGQDMVDARSREANSATMSKPFEVTGPDGQAVLVQQDKQGNIVPVQGYQPKGGGKPLPQSAVKQLTEVRDNAVTIDRLSGSFKPEYAGKGFLGFGADMQLDASGRIGADKDAVEWWKNYRKQAELVERHSLFGAALTPTEQASWRNADIGPGMHPDVVRRNLQTRRELAARVLDTTRQDLIDAGQNEQRVNKISGRGPSGATSDVSPDVDALLKKYGGK